ncbi:MAG: hypothetical protein AAFN10_29290, partial [Bacteroidota bacterium]
SFRTSPVNDSINKCFPDTSPPSLRRNPQRYEIGRSVIVGIGRAANHAAIYTINHRYKSKQNLQLL